MKWFGKYGRKVSRILIRYEQHGRKASWNVKWHRKYERKVSRIVIRYEQHGRKASWNVKWYRKYGRKISWTVKWFGKYRRKLWNDRENMEKNSEMIWKIWKKASRIVKRYEKYRR